MTAKTARKSPKMLTIWAIHKRLTAGILGTSRKPRTDAGLDIVVRSLLRDWLMIAFAGVECRTVHHDMLGAMHEGSKMRLTDRKDIGVGLPNGTIVYHVACLVEEHVDGSITL